MHPLMFHEAVSLPGFFEKRAPFSGGVVSSSDEAAFCALYRSTAPALQGYIRKACGNAALAEDMLQETFYRFLRADVPEMDAHQTKSYLFKIATSLLVDHWRREKREKLWQSLWRAPVFAQGGQMGDVSHALSALKPAERALLWLAYVEGFDHGEIASTLGLKEKSIRVLLFRARKNLARILGRRDGTYGATS
jgi:RNA polymerase sigma-70 factor, ECF subfamily